MKIEEKWKVVQSKLDIPFSEFIEIYREDGKLKEGDLFFFERDKYSFENRNLKEWDGKEDLNIQLLYIEKELEQLVVKLKKHIIK